jgi:hypothetical protein
MSSIPFTVDELFLQAIADRVASVVLERLEVQSQPSSPWLDAAGAADYACMTADAIRAAEKRGQLRSHRSSTGRVRYRREDVDAFLRGEE